MRPPSRASGNRFYPLPPHYDALSDKEQKYARLNAVRLQETPDDLVWAWTFFRTYYLRRAGKMFYRRYRESPAFHYQMVRDIGRYPRNAIAAPRGTSKSTILAVEVPLLMLLTRPHFKILLLLSTEQMVTMRMQTQILRQLERNPYILEDFGKVLPSKGSGAKNVHLTQTLFDSVIECKSVRGALLGARPDLALVDDPEVDPKLQKVKSELVEEFSQFLVEHLMPMLDEGESSLYWIGTLLSKKCFLNYVVTVSERRDPRFAYWNRRLLDCEDDGSGKLLWPEKFSHERLSRERSMLGKAAYNAQRRNRPGTGTGDEMLPLHDKLSCYEHVDVSNPEVMAQNPLAADGILRAWKGTADDPKPVDRPWAKTVLGMFRVCFLDWAACRSPTSDYCAIHVIGSESVGPFAGCWWSLDLRVERLPGTRWLQVLYNMASRWRCTYMGIEAVAAQRYLVDAAQAYADHAAVRHGWVPRSVPITYESNLTKEERIAALQPRYERYMFKYPRHRKHEFSYRQLWDQTTEFTGEKGCLQYDDALDTCAMAPYLLKGRRGVALGGDNDQGVSYNLEEMLIAGEKLPGGLAPILGCDVTRMSPELIHKIMWRELDEREAKRQRESTAGRKRGQPWIGSLPGASTRR